MEQGQILAAECVFGELLQGAKNNRERSIISEYWNNIPKIEEKGIWLEAGEFSGKQKLLSKGIGLLDIVILLIAKKANAKLWTLDKKLLSLLKPAETYHI